MKRNEDFCGYSVNNWQGINMLSKRIQAINCLIDVFGSDEVQPQPLANDYQEVSDWLINDFEQTMEALLQLVEIKDEME